jgi:hypothetical protein
VPPLPLHVGTVVPETMHVGADVGLSVLGLAVLGVIVGLDVGGDVLGLAVLGVADGLDVGATLGLAVLGVADGLAVEGDVLFWSLSRRILTGLFGF